MIHSGNMPKMPKAGREYMGHFDNEHIMRMGHNVKHGKGQGKVHKVMSEFKRGELHSGSKHGPIVTSRAQAQAIAMSEAGLSRNKKHK